MYHRAVLIVYLYDDNIILWLSVSINVLMMIGQSDSNIVTGFKWIIEGINVHH